MKAIVVAGLVFGFTLAWAADSHAVDRVLVARDGLGAVMLTFRQGDCPEGYRVAVITRPPAFRMEGCYSGESAWWPHIGLVGLNLSYFREITL